MIFKIINSLKRINYRLLISLFFIGIVPTFYTTLRVFFLGQLPGEYSFSIAGQLSWVNLLYEILNESIILPLFFFIGEAVQDKNTLTNRIKSALFITFCIYFILSALVMLFVNPLLKIMAVNQDIISASASYIRIESVALIFSVLVNFIFVVFVTLDRTKYIYTITYVKLFLCFLFDVFLISDLPFSANIGVVGIGISNVIVNIVILVINFICLTRQNICLFSKEKLSFSWMKSFVKVGGVSGLESFVRNIAYMFMIVRMVNVVNEQGIYWVANNFIWGWLLLPITQLAEYIKKDVATDKNAVKNKSLAYFAITFIICLLWVMSIPLWKPFMTNILCFNDADKLFEIVTILVGFYVLYAFQNVFDSTFYGMGKTGYMLFESVITNVIYYGIAFVLYVADVWNPTLTGIVYLFGIGIAFDSFVSLGAYIYFLKKRKINILYPEL